MDVQKIIALFTKMLKSKNEKVEFRCRRITKVEVYYEDDIILTLKDGEDIEKEIL